MRVLVVSDVSGYMPGGVPAETLHLLQGLMSRGHDVALAGDIALGGPGIGHYPVTTPTGDALAAELKAALTAFRPDVVHVMAMSSPGVARLAPVFAGVPWVFTCHSAPPYERKLAHFHHSEALHYVARSLRFLPNTLAWRWLLRRQVMPVVITHSEFVQEIVVRYGCARDKAVLIPLGHDVAPALSAGPSTRTAVGSAPLIVTVGGIAHTKGQHDMIAALASVVERYPQARYCLIGENRDASYTNFLDGRIAGLGLGPNVERRHGLSHADKDALLARAHLYVQPSHEEGFCLAFIEAAGVVPRLVGTATGAIRAMCEDDPAATVVASRAPKALAEAVLDLLGRDPPADVLEARTHRLASRFAWASYLDAHETLYERLRHAQLGRFPA